VGYSCHLPVVPDAKRQFGRHYNIRMDIVAVANQFNCMDRDSVSQQKILFRHDETSLPDARDDFIIPQPVLAIGQGNCIWTVEVTRWCL